MERRQFIAGSAVAALSVSTLPIAAATAPLPDRRQWDRALLDYRQAEARLDAHCAEPCPNKRPAIAFYESTTDALAGAHAEAFDRLMLIPAPTLAELAIKLEQWVKVVRGDCWHSAHECLTQIAADSRRFATNQGH